MKIGILGSGDVGRKLGDGLIEIGHQVKIGTLDPNKEQIVQWLHNYGDGEKQKASVGSFAEAASFGDGPPTMFICGNDFKTYFFPPLTRFIERSIVVC